MNDTPYTASSFLVNQFHIRDALTRKYVGSILAKTSTRITTLELNLTGWDASDLTELGALDFIQSNQNLKKLKLDLQPKSHATDFRLLETFFQSTKRNNSLSAVEIDASVSIFSEKEIMRLFEWMRGIKLTALHLGQIRQYTPQMRNIVFPLATCICSLQNTKTMILHIKSHSFLTNLSVSMRMTRMPNLEKLELVLCSEHQQYEMTTLAGYLSSPTACFLTFFKLRFDIYLDRDMIDTMFLGLRQNTSIRELWLGFYKEMDAEEMECVRHNLASLSNIEQLTLHTVHHEISFPVSVWPVLCNMDKLCRLELYDFELEGASQAKDLLMHSSQRLKHLHLDLGEHDDSFGISDWLQTMASGLCANTGLMSLSFEVTVYDFEGTDVKPLLDGVLASWENKSNLAELSINAIRLHAEFSSDLASLLVDPACKLFSLVLDVQLNGPETVRVLSAVLLCPTLKKLKIEKLDLEEDEDEDEEASWIRIASIITKLRLESIRLEVYAPEDQDDGTAIRVSKELLRGVAENSFLLDASFHLGLPEKENMLLSTALEECCFRNKVLLFSRSLQDNTSLLPLVPKFSKTIDTVCNQLVSASRDSLKATLLFSAIRGRADLLVSPVKLS